MAQFSQRKRAERSDFKLDIPASLITYAHPGGTKFADITEEIRTLAAASPVKEGFLLLNSESRKLIVVIQEARHFVEKDLMERLQAYANPPTFASFFQRYQALPIKAGELTLGKCQSILAVRFGNGFPLNGLSRPALSVTPVSGTLETRIVDTGNFFEPVYVRNRSNYADRGSERVFDVTGLIKDTARRVAQSSGIKPGAIYTGTGNTTCVLFSSSGYQPACQLQARMDNLAPPSLPAFAYSHNDLEARRNRLGIPPDKRQNGRAHVCAAILQSSLLFPDSGPRDRVYLVELDGPRKGRTLNIGISGVPYSKLMACPA